MAICATLISYREKFCAWNCSRCSITRSDKEVKGPSTLAPFADVACLTFAPSAGIMASHTKAQRRLRSASKDLGNGSAQRGDIVEAKIKDITDEALLLELDSAFQPKVPVVPRYTSLMLLIYPSSTKPPTQKFSQQSFQLVNLLQHVCYGQHSWALLRTMVREKRRACNCSW